MNVPDSWVISGLAAQVARPDAATVARRMGELYAAEYPHLVPLTLAFLDVFSLVLTRADR